MEAIILKTNLHCNSCVEKVEPMLNSFPGIEEYYFDLEHPDKIISIKGKSLNSQDLIAKIHKAGYQAEVAPPQRIIKTQQLITPTKGFWKNRINWRRASFNTVNCLIGCSIGDFGMIIFLQAYYPGTPMYLQMILAIVAGLMTSIALESTILRVREKFNWPLALKTAFSMSFISMIGMEIAMNMTDFVITGGKAAFNTADYWLALVPAMVAGFLFPLPYNYYKLQKHGKACH
jgi:copper chaperone CopZ